MLNVVALQGRLTKDLKVFEKFVSFSIAVNYGKDQTIYVDCIAFGLNMDYLKKYARKGKRVIVQGRLENKRVDEKYADVEAINKWQIVVLDASVIDFKDTDVLVEVEEQPKPKTKTAEQIYQETESDDDLPF